MSAETQFETFWVVLTQKPFEFPSDFKPYLRSVWLDQQSVDNFPHFCHIVQTANCEYMKNPNRWRYGVSFRPLSHYELAFNNAMSQMN
jgi:hypothetical protein